MMASRRRTRNVPASGNIERTGKRCYPNAVEHENDWLAASELPGIAAWRRRRLQIASCARPGCAAATAQTRDASYRQSSRSNTDIETSRVCDMT